MKVFVALLVCVVIAAEAAVDKAKLKDKFKTSLDSCLDDPSVGITRDEFKQLTAANASRATPKPAIQNAGKLSMCILKKLGWMKADNTFDTTELKQLVEEMDDAQLGQAMIRECTTDKGNPEHNAAKMMECLTQFIRTH